MKTTPTQPHERSSRQAAWSPLVSQLHRSDAPSGAINLNVEGRQVVGPLQGFGQLWQKTYKVRLSGVNTTPAEVIQTWKENFPKFWPVNNYFYAPLTGITPGEVAVLNLEMPGGMPLSTGMLVLYADDESFTLMTPQGHMESGWITFSAFEEDDCTVVQVQSMARANDPMYEVGFWLFAHRKQEAFWEETLRALAAHFGINGQVRMHKTCVDRRLQWSQARNIWHNAAIRTAIYAPVHFFKKQFASSR
jgi:hypothetical protein